MNGFGSQVQYSRVATQELSSALHGDDSTVEEGQDSSVLQYPTRALTSSSAASSNIDEKSESSIRRHSLVIGNDIPNPFTRRPLKARDLHYAAFFFLHFGLVSVLSGTEGLALHDSFTAWSSMVMIATVLGASLGLPLVAIFGGKLIEGIITSSLPIAVLGQICFGNVLLLMKSRYSIFGMFFLISSLIDAFSFKASYENLSFTTALLKTSEEICRAYGLSLSFTCFAIIVVQTCVLLWWGFLFVGLITKAPSEISEALVVLMLFSLYWTMKFFQSLVDFIVGGCVLWHFTRESESGSSSGAFDPNRRVILHIHCALTSSLGTICKGAALSSISDVILSVDHWAKGRGDYVPPYSTRGCVRSFVSGLVPMAKRNHRLALCLTATYGRTLSKASEVLMQTHPEVIDIVTEDTSSHCLYATAKTITTFIVSFFALFASRTEGASWSMFLIIIALVAVSGVSLSLRIYSAGTDAIFVAFFMQPERLRQENQIIYLRFLRTTEAALR